MSIQRLNSAMKNALKLDKLDSRSMHIVSDVSKLNKSMPTERYNIRNMDGSINKYSVHDNFVIVENLKKNKIGSYERCNLKIFGDTNVFDVSL